MYTKSKFFACIAIVLLSMTAIQATFETTPPNQLPTTQPPTLSFPVDNATNVEVSPTFKWNETLTNATIEIYEGNTFNDTPRNNLDLNNYQLVNSHKINNVGEDLSGVAYSPVTNSLYMVNNKKPIAAYITNLIGGETHQIDLIGFDDVEDIVHIDGNKFAVIEETEGLVNYVDITRQIDEIKHSDVALTDQLSGYPIDSNKDGAEGVSFDPENNDIYVVTEDDFKLHRFSIGSTNNSTNDTELTTVNGSSLGLGNLSAIYHLARPSGLDNLAVDGHFLLLSADSEKLVETDLSFTNYGEIDLLDELKPLGLFRSYPQLFVYLQTSRL